MERTQATGACVDHRGPLFFSEETWTLTDEVTYSMPSQGCVAELEAAD